MIADGFEWVVVDPAAFLQDSKQNGHLPSPVSVLKFETVTESAGGKGWKITKLHKPIVIDNIEMVEKLGTRTEEAPQAEGKNP